MSHHHHQIPRPGEARPANGCRPGEPRIGTRSTTSTNGALTDIAKSCFQNLSVWCCSASHSYVPLHPCSPGGRGTQLGRQRSQGTRKPSKTLGLMRKPLTGPGHRHTQTHVTLPGKKEPACITTLAVTLLLQPLCGIAAILALHCYNIHHCSQYMAVKPIYGIVANLWHCTFVVFVLFVDFFKSKQMWLI